MNAGRSLSGDPPGAGCGLRFPARASGEPTGHTREGRGAEGPAGCPERAHSSVGRRTPAPCVTAPRVAAAHVSPGEAHPRGRRAGACGAAEPGREDWAPGALSRPLGAEPQAVRPGVGRHSALAPRAPTPVTALPGCCLRRPLKGSRACPTLAQLQPERTPQMQAVSSWPAKLMWFEGEPVLEGSSCAGCTSSHVGDMSDVHTVVNELVV